MPNLSPREYLRQLGATIVRTKNHEVWKLPNGKIVSLSVSPSRLCEKKQMADIKRRLSA